MRRWRGILYALPLLVAPLLPAADNLDSAARELARRIPAGLRAPVFLDVRILSDLPPQAALDVRRVLESEVRARGLALAETPAADEIHVALSQNIAGYLLVAEIRRGEERQVVLVPWSRAPGPPQPAGPAISLQKSLIAELPDPILDAAPADADWLLLQPGGMVRVARENGRSIVKESASFGPLALPRDPRGRLVVQAGAYLAYLSGTICSGAVAPLDARCRDAAEPWPLLRDPALRAVFARGRDYFDGRVTAAGGARSAPPFYSIAAAEENAGRLWILAALDGRTYLADAAFARPAPLAEWGSDLAGIPNPCGGGSLLLATRPGDGSAADALHVYRIVERQPVDASAAIDLPGPVTALWPGDGASAIVVARDPGSSRYAAYTLGITCGH